MTRIVFLLGAMMIWLGLAPASAATHVLLVGASRYDNLPPEKHLQAPNADVLAMRDALRGWGVPPDTMRLLGDGLAGAQGRPTRAVILSELDRLATAAVQPGDWVVIYLSGHGAIVRDATGTQRSGLNSVFLPADVRWPSPDDLDSTPENALFDTRIGQALDAIRARGADVWFINDSCHSGDTVRSANAENVREKSVAPPRRSARPARPQPLAARKPAENLPGRLVAFYAAQVTETAREFRGEDGVWRSAFTQALAGAMRTAPVRDARSLIAAAVFATRAMRPLGIFQTPYADEDLPPGALLLGADAPPLRNPLEGTATTLNAGLLDGIDTGAEITLADNATSTTVLARATVAAGGLTRSRIALIEGILPSGVWFARLAAAAPETRLSIAAGDGSGPEAAALAAALDAISSEKLQPFRRAEAQASADVVILPEPGRLRLVARRALLGIVDGGEIPLPKIEAGDLKRMLATRLQRLDFLRRIERAQGAANLLTARERYQVQMNLRRFAGKSGSPCPSPARDVIAEGITPALPLAACDAIEVEIRNVSDRPRYVQVLAIHPDGRIQTIAPRCGAGNALKLEAGQATAARHSAGAKSALPVIWFSLPHTGSVDVRRMAIQLVSTPIDGAALAPDPCQFERFNGLSAVPTRGQAPLFEEDARAGAAKPGEILLTNRILTWAAR